MRRAFAMSYLPVLCVFVGVSALWSGCSKPAEEPTARATPATIKAGTTLTANPDPILLSGNSPVGKTTITWSTTAAHTQLRIGGPKGKLFWVGGAKGSASTGEWVNNGMTFFLQNMDAADPDAPDATLGSLTMVVQRRD